jgi:signal transduction histidine kinase
VSDLALREQELLDRLGWFIRVRWLFLAGLAGAVLTGATLLRLAFPVRPTLAVGAVVLAYNVALFLYHRFGLDPGARGLTASRVEATLQIGLDLLALTALVHLAGGAGNPFVCFYLFHVIVGSMLLSRRAAWLVGLAAFALFASVVVLECAGVLPHHDLTGFADGRHRHVPYLATVCFAFLGTLLSAIAITSSIVGSLRLRERELVCTQRALLKKSHDLEAAYATLTENQRHLVHTEKEASLGQLVAGIAHEINNPIQFIRGNMGVLSEAFHDVLPMLDAQSAARPDLRIARLDYPFFRKQVPELLKDITDGAARIDSIVRDLKTFARRDEGRLDEDVDLNEVVCASLRLLHSQLKRFRVEESLHTPLPRLRGSLTRLEQVVVATLQNAVEALGHDPRGTIRIRTCVEEGGEVVRLSIEDNGPGMTAEVKDRIFDPFFTTKHRTGGTGLGLAITYGIVEQHQGRIEVDTRLGEGTVFHYLLPVHRRGAP